MKPLPKRKCKVCKQVFQKTKPTQMVCGYKCASDYVRNQKKKAWNKEKKARKEALKTRGDYLKELQTVFNRWIRLRDQGEPCISCQKPCKKENAGHFQAVNKKPELRFEPLNVHLQCEYCNTYLHSNATEYRKQLVKKIGVDNVEWLEGKHEPLKLTIPEIILMKEEYKERIRRL